MCTTLYKYDRRNGDVVLGRGRVRRCTLVVDASNGLFKSAAVLCVLICSACVVVSCV